MNVFNLRDTLVADYQRFARSFTTIRADDIRDQVEAEYKTGRFWPDPLIQVNPRFEPVDELVARGHARCDAHTVGAGPGVRFPDVFTGRSQDRRPGRSGASHPARTMDC